MGAYCFQAYADADVIPTALAEKAGLNPIAFIMALWNRHSLDEWNAGINVHKGQNILAKPPRLYVEEGLSRPMLQRYSYQPRLYFE